MQRRCTKHSDPRYKKIREQNNISVKKSREKSLREQEQTIQSLTQLEQQNEQLTENIQQLKQEYEQLQNLFKEHTGIDMDKVITSNPNPTSSLPTLAPKRTTEILPNQVLTINTIEEKSPELDAKNLDGSIVLINGVQYQIVRMNGN